MEVQGAARKVARGRGLPRSYKADGRCTRTVGRATSLDEVCARSG